MKYKVIGIILFAFILCASLLISTYYDEGSSRYHQHLEAMKPKNDFDYSQINESYSNANQVDVETLFSHLPLIEIDTNGMDIPGENSEENSRVLANIQVYNNKNDLNNINDKPELDSLSLIKYRGNSSLTFEKKGFSIKLTNKNGSENHQKILGMNKHNEWVLHGPYLDKTMIRNYMWYNISGEIMEYAPEVRFCELILNGEYQGIYLLVESISASNNGRIPIRKNVNSDTITSYILELNINRVENIQYKSLHNFSDYTNFMEDRTILEVVYPVSKNITSSQYYYIQNDVSQFERALYSYDYDDPKKGYKKYIDVNNFIDYVILNEFVVNMDAGHRSTFLYKDPKGKFNLVVWDFNNVLDNYFIPTFEEMDFILNDRLWFSMLYRDEEFTQRVIKRYQILRTTYLSDEYLNNYIEDVVAYLGDAIGRNFQKWGFSFSEEYNYMFNMITPDIVHPDLTRHIKSFDEAILKYKEAITTRSTWLDQNINSLKQFSHESKVKKYNP